MSQVLSKEFEGKAFLFREDGWFNMNKAATKFGKHMHHFWSNKETHAYIRAVVEQLHGIPCDSPWHEQNALGGGFLTQSKRGCHGGTWGHPKLAVFFARWLDPKFAVFCDTVIQDILSKKADVVFTPEASTPKLPQTYLESLQELVLAVAEAERLKDANAALEAANARLLPAATVGQAVSRRVNLGVVEFARKLPGVNSMQVQKDLQVMQYLYKREGHWAVYSKHKGTLFDEVLDLDGRSKIIALEQGQQLLVRLYNDSRLTMKNGCKPVQELVA